MTPAPAAGAPQVEAFTRPPPSLTPRTPSLSANPPGRRRGAFFQTPRRRSALLSAVFKALAAFLTRSLGPSSIPPSATVLWSARRE